MESVKILYRFMVIIKILMTKPPIDNGLLNNFIP